VVPKITFSTRFSFPPPFRFSFPFPSVHAKTELGFLRTITQILSFHRRTSIKKGHQSWLTPECENKAWLLAKIIVYKL
jgi:hypothetical protein